MEKTFDAAAFATVALGLKQGEIPYDCREFMSSLDRAIISIEKLGENPKKFAGSHGDSRDPVWRIAAHLVGKHHIRNSDQVFTLMRELRNRLRRIRMNHHSDYDVSVVTGLSDFIFQSEIFVEAA